MRNRFGGSAGVVGCFVSRFAVHSLLARQQQNWVLDFRWQESIGLPLVSC